MKTIFQKSNQLMSHFLFRISLLTFILLIFIGRDFSDAQTSFSFTEIPYADPDILAPHRGTEEWMVMNQVNIPTEGTYTHPMDAYYRFEWTDIETAKGVFNWTNFDAAFKRALDKGQKFSFGIMPMCSSCTGTSVDGAKLTYPVYLHYEMQTETIKDWIYNGLWIPNWNSNYFLSAWENMLKAVASHMNNTYINNIKLNTIVNYIDIRGYGNWGEWHNYPYGDAEPLSNRATVTSLLRIINAHKSAFPDNRLIALSDAFDISNWSRVPAEVGYELLTASNNIGEFGWRRDNWGDPAFWFKNKLENNTTIYNGKLFSDMIMNKWKNAPIVGEPSSCCTINGGNCQYWELETQIRRYHALSFGNGNIEASATTCVRDNIRNAAKAAGYRLLSTGGTMTTNLISGNTFNIQLNWQNKGITPTYEKWNIIYELRNSSNIPVWTGTSIFKPYMFQPQLTATAIEDNFTLPASVPSGVYNLVMMVIDPSHYRKPLPLAIKGRNPDGSYLLRNVSVVANNDSTTQVPPLEVSITSITHASCFGAYNGSLTAIVKGGKAPYSYNWNTNPIQIYPTATNLGAGNYTLIVIDSLGKSITASGSINQPDKLILSVKNDSISIYGGTTNVYLSAIGGTPPYLYTGPTTNVSAGTYTYVAIDANGCSDSKTITIDQPPLRRIKKKYRNLFTTTNTSSLADFAQVQKENNIQAYPNPVKNELILQINNEWIGKGMIQIFNMNGISVKQEYYVKPTGFYQIKINTSNLISGIYIILIQNSDSEFRIIKFIKQE